MIEAYQWHLQMCPKSQRLSLKYVQRYLGLQMSLGGNTAGFADDVDDEEG